MKRTTIVLLIASWLAACATAQVPGPVASPPNTASQSPVASAPASTPAPASASSKSDPLHPDRSCKVDADCQVKDVGNCCGAYPECVNKDAAVDPRAVKAQCASEHRMGMCHVMAVGGCSCVRGQCGDINAAQMPKKP